MPSYVTPKFALGPVRLTDGWNVSGGMPDGRGNSVWRLRFGPGCSASHPGSSAPPGSHAVAVAVQNNLNSASNITGASGKGG